MKKFLIACLVIFLAGVGCKKTNIDGSRLCGCSPIQQPELMLVVKTTAGDDLLNSKNTGAYTKNSIQLFKKDANGNPVQLSFAIRPPFTYYNDKFGYSTLYSAAINTVKQSGESVYLKFGDEPAYELNLQFSANKPLLDKLFINNNEAERDKGPWESYLSVFYLTK